MSGRKLLIGTVVTAFFVAGSAVALYAQTTDSPNDVTESDITSDPVPASAPEVSEKAPLSLAEILTDPTLMQGSYRPTADVPQQIASPAMP